MTIEFFHCIIRLFRDNGDAKILVPLLYQASSCMDSESFGLLKLLYPNVPYTFLPIRGNLAYGSFAPNNKLLAAIIGFFENLDFYSSSVNPEDPFSFNQGFRKAETSRFA